MAARQETPNVHEIAMQVAIGLASNPDEGGYIQKTAKSHGLTVAQVVAALSYEVAEALIAESANH